MIHHVILVGVRNEEGVPISKANKLNDDIYFIPGALSVQQYSDRPVCENHLSWTTRRRAVGKRG